MNKIKIKHSLLLKAKAHYLGRLSSDYICINLRYLCECSEEPAYRSLRDEISQILEGQHTVEHFLFGEVEMYALPRTDRAYLMMSCSMKRVEIFDKLIAKYAPLPSPVPLPDPVPSPSYDVGELITFDGSIILKLLTSPVEGYATVEVMESDDEELVNEVFHNTLLLPTFDKTLRQFYVEQVSQQFEFETIKMECLSYINLPPEGSSDEPTGHYLIGSILSLAPSGKFYMPWSSNVSEFEAQKDELWNEAMEEVFGAHNLYLESGEGDGLDIFACCFFSWEDIARFRNLDGEDYWEKVVRLSMS